MMNKNEIAPDVDAYIAGFPPATQKLLKQVRAAIKKGAPNAEESISYSMPAYKLSGPLVYFAGYKNHLGFYPGPSAIKKFKENLSAYKGAKGTVQFPIDEAPPLSLITQMVAYRVLENEEKAKAKAKKKSKA